MLEVLRPEGPLARLYPQAAVGGYSAILSDPSVDEAVVLALCAALPSSRRHRSLRSTWSSSKRRAEFVQ